MMAWFGASSIVAIAAFCLAGPALAQSPHTKIAVDNEPCIRDLTNGCSIPLGLPFPYKEFFMKACQKHDVCYSCGKIYNWTRAECDHAFADNMDSLCVLWDKGSNTNSFFLWDVYERLEAVFTVTKDLAKWLLIECNTLGHCLHASKVYYRSVDKFGAGNYGSGDPAKCSLQCAKSFGAPNNKI